MESKSSSRAMLMISHTPDIEKGLAQKEVCLSQSGESSLNPAHPLHQKVERLKRQKSTHIRMIQTRSSAIGSGTLFTTHKSYRQYVGEQHAKECRYCPCVRAGCSDRCNHGDTVIAQWKRATNSFPTVVAIPLKYLFALRC